MAIYNIYKGRVLQLATSSKVYKVYQSNFQTISPKNVEDKENRDTVASINPWHLIDNLDGK